MSMILTLLVIAFLLFFFEIFAPGGILALVGAIVVLWASGLAFVEFGFFGAIGIFLIGALGGIALFFLEIYLIQRTGMGRQLSLGTAITSQTNPVTVESRNLVGKHGVTLTRLAPAGKVRIDGQSHTALSRGSYLEEGVDVRVVRAETFNLIVEKS